MHRTLLMFALGGLAVGCLPYSPTFTDCGLQCSADGGCPAGTTCQAGYCRAPGAQGSCECTQPCPLTKGVCAGSRGPCADGGPALCTARNYGPTYQQQETACDGLDNDCDGEIDLTPAVLITSQSSNEWFLFG